MKILSKRLVVSTRGNKTYHYWRKTYKIDKSSMFYIQESTSHKGIEVSSKHYVIYRGVPINSYDEICDIIDSLILQRSREMKLNKII